MTKIEAITRPAEPGGEGTLSPRGRQLFTSGFEWVLQPTRPITGIVRDAASGEPLADVEVRSQVLVGPSSRFRVSQAMLGGASLAIDHQGAGEPIANAILATHTGEPPMTFAEALEQMGEVMAENRKPLNQAITGLPAAIDNFAGMSGAVRDAVQENREHLKEAVISIRDMGRQLADAVAENRQDLNQAIRRIDAMAAQIHDLVAENRPALKATADRLPQAVASIEQAAAQMRDLLVENRANLGTMMGSLASFTPKLDRIGDDLAAIMAQIRSGQGTLGRLVFEDTLHAKATTTLDSFNQRLEEVEPLTSGISGLKIYTGVQGGANIDTGAGTGGAYIRLEPKPWKLYEVGLGYRGAPEERDTIEDDPEDLPVDFSLLVGYRFFRDDEEELYRLTARAGLIDSKIGGQLDYALWGDRLTASAMMRTKHDGFDERDRRFEEGDNPLLRSWLEWRFWRRVGLIAGVDDILHDTYYVVAHFHYVMFGGMVIAFLCALHHWWPKMFGRMYHEPSAMIGFFLVFIGFNLTFFIQFLMGFNGMPRRYASYVEEYQLHHFVSTIGSWVLAAGFFVHLGVFLHSLVAGRKAHPNPWGSLTLEWETDPPPIEHNFEHEPLMRHGPYDYDDTVPPQCDPADYPLPAPRPDGHKAH